MSAPKGWTGIEAGNEQGHTPLPWKYDGAGYGNIRPMIEDGRNVCTFTRAFSLTEQMMNDANARFICKAVNCHDGLVEECRSAQAIVNKLIEALKECITEDGAVAWRNHPFAGQRLEAISNIARKALKKAGGA